MNNARDSQNHSRGNDDPLLRIDSLTCARGGRRLFSGLDLAVAGGEAVQLSGANGSGKTTLLRTLSGLQRPRKGRVHWRGADVHTGEGYAGGALYLAHENALNPDLTPGENLALLAALQSTNEYTDSRPAGSRAVDDALAALDVATVAKRPCRRLSAGQRRRVALARLWFSSAPLWLLDEPAAALDSAGREILARLLARHVADGGLVLFSTHEPLELPGVAPRALQL